MRHHSPRRRSLALAVVFAHLLTLPNPALALRAAGLEENAAKDEVAQLLHGAGPAELPAAELLEEGQLTDEQWQWVEDHRSTIETVIRRLWRRGWEIPLEGEEGWEDLRQEGYLALARGVVGFDRSHPAPRSRQLQYRKIGDVPHYVERAMIRYLEQTRDPMTNPLWRDALILLQEQASGEQSLAQTLRRRELREALAAALSRLPDDQQQLVQMWFDEKTSRGWAQKFRVREVIARARLLRSLRSLARSPELVAWGEHYGVIPTPPPRERGRVTLRRALQAGPSPDTLSVVMAALQNPSAGARRQAAVALRRWLKDSTGKPLLLAQAEPLMDALVTAMEHAQQPNDGGAVSAARTLEALAAYPEAYPILEQVGPRLEALQVVATGRIRTWIARLLEYSRYQVVLALREWLLDRSGRRPLLRTHAAPFVAALVSVVEQGQGWPRDRAAEAAVDLLDFLAVFYREFHPALMQVRSRLEALRAVTTGITQEKITSLLARQEIFYEPSTASSSPTAGLEEPEVEGVKAVIRGLQPEASETVRMDALQTARGYADWWSTHPGSSTPLVRLATPLVGGLVRTLTDDNIFTDEDGVYPEPIKLARQSLVALVPDATFHPALRTQVPTVVELAGDPLYPEIRVAGQRILTALARHTAFHEPLRAVAVRIIRQTVSNFTWDPDVRAAAEDTLIAMTQHEVFHPALSDAGAIVWAMENRTNRDPKVRHTAMRILITAAPFPLFQSQLLGRGLTPEDVGFPERSTWSQLAVFSKVWQSLEAQPTYAALALGAKAALRWRLLLATRQGQDAGALTATAQILATHLVRLEAFDRALGFPSMGAELHPVPPMDPAQQAALLTAATTGQPAELPALTPDQAETLTRTTHAFASGVGPHALSPIHQQGPSHLDLRLLPATPSTFAPSLALFLQTDALERVPQIAAHYSVGVDLGQSLVPLAFALFYGDPVFPWLPYPAGPGDTFGFPGLYTYRGATLDLTTGQETVTRQSNLHLRPVRMMVSPRDAPYDRPVDLFTRDLEQLPWLATAAAAAPDTLLGRVFQDFRTKFIQWLAARDAALPALVTAAEQAMVTTTGQRVNTALDTASRRLYEALYGISAATVSARTPPGLTSEEVASAAHARQALATLITHTLEAIQTTLIPHEAVRAAIQAYRHAPWDDPAALDRAYDHAVTTLKVALTEDPAIRPDSPEAQQLERLLAAIDPAAAAIVRQRHEPHAAGLEEVPEEIRAGWRALNAIGDSVAAASRQEVQGALMDVLDFGELLEEGEDFRELVFAVYGRPRARELHVHCGPLGAQLPIAESGQLEFPLWMERTGHDDHQRHVFVPIERDQLPKGFLNHLNQQAQASMGRQWSKRVLSTEPGGVYFVAEPLLAAPANEQAFLQRLGQSQVLAECVRQQAWNREQYHMYGMHGPFVATGQMRLILQQWFVNIDDTRSATIVPDDGTREARARYWQHRSHVLAFLDPVDNTPAAYYRDGFLLVPPGMTFTGREALLEQIFLWSAELSQQLAWSDYMPRRPSAAGLEEGAVVVDMLVARFQERVTPAVRRWVVGAAAPNPERVGIIVEGAMPGALTLATGLEELGVPVVVVQPEEAARQTAQRFVQGTIPIVAGVEEARAVLAKHGATPVILPAAAGLEGALQQLQRLGVWPLGRDLQPLLAAGLEEARLLQAAAQYST